jgi:hypothetical protein
LVSGLTIETTAFALSVAQKAMTASTSFSASTITRSPRRTPRCTSAFERASISRYVSRRSRETSAILSGRRRADERR